MLCCQAKSHMIDQRRMCRNRHSQVRRHEVRNMNPMPITAVTRLRKAAAKYPVAAFLIT